MIVDIEASSRILNRVLLRYIILSRGSIVAKNKGIPGSRVLEYVGKACRSNVCMALLRAPGIWGDIYVSQGVPAAVNMEVDGEYLSGGLALEKLKELGEVDVEVYAFNPEVVDGIYRQVDSLIKDVKGEVEADRKTMTIVNTLLKLTDTPCYMEELRLSGGEDLLEARMVCVGKDLSFHAMLLALRILDLYSVAPSTLRFSTRLKTLEHGVLVEKKVEGDMEIHDDTTRNIYVNLPSILASAGSHVLRAEVDRERGKTVVRVEATPPALDVEPDELAAMIHRSLSKSLRRLEVIVEYVVETAVGPVKVSGKAPAP
ncbi:hypothetical protein [Desulfurococcus mucosus]|uniref:Uncharacterized protein n=1 Tax=Desulfurococcus mucosus (strain ATCC 35584 / DSM 2162 / JCM 9187 / O7/1) TaxID=765177 RepID=E8R7Z3_DESM0|nr:hypothetical protein [Desulfurococcus mucosus]ADV64619.1 hypothetical protein Desmu_0300 [Desulfurococcus mucosus DSM 2162]